LPAWSSPYYQSRYLVDGGRLFFDSSDALVAQDTNRAGDVYEFEPPAAPGAPAGDTCTIGQVGYSAASGGCVGLISSGESPEGAVFLDASENGEDVFFLTAGQLVKQDSDTSGDVYDAHVCSGVASCPETEVPKPQCVGDSCQGVVEAPGVLTPGSLTFQGPHNRTPTPGVASPPKPKPKVKCKKPKKLSHGKCVKPKKPKKPKKHKAKKANNKRRAHA